MEVTLRRCCRHCPFIKTFLFSTNGRVIAYARHFGICLAPSVRQNSSADNPFVGIFVIDDSGLVFENYLVTTNIWTTKIQVTKMTLDSLLTDIFHVEACCRLKFYALRLVHFLQCKIVRLHVLRKCEIDKK